LYVAHCLPVAPEDILSRCAFWSYLRQWSWAIASISPGEDRQVSPAAHSISTPSGASETICGYAHVARKLAAAISKLSRVNIKPSDAALRIIGSRSNTAASLARIGLRPITAARSTNMAKIRDFGSSNAAQVFSHRRRRAPAIAVASFGIIEAHDDLDRARWLLFAARCAACRAHRAAIDLSARGPLR
jgi:hypothetical protein